MSYILDALKKSEQERQQNNGPTLQTVQHSQLGQSHSSAVPWLIIILVLLVGLLSGFSGWYFLTRSSESAVSNTPLSGTSVTPVEQQQKSSANPVNTIQQPVSEPTVAIASNSTPIISPPEKPAIVELWELPDAVQQQLPPMTFSFHVYSDNPQRRTIIINNRRLKQGDSVVPGLLLEEITPQGIVFYWQSKYLFSINVVENW